MMIGMKNELVMWYRIHQKQYPWRNTNDPYDVWISEIMLQQTRIEAVIPKFLEFKKAFPNVQALASAQLDEVYRVWQGLGYYSRALNLHRAAKVIVEQYHGQLPTHHQQLLVLPGIGPYTAGAIGSIAFDLPTPAVDGNVLRVICRIYGIYDDVRLPSTRHVVEERLKPWYQMDSQENGDITQGLMEVGQSLCLPKGKPHCQQCPFQEHCVTAKHDLYQEIPYRSKNAQRKVEQRTILLLQYHDEVVLQKRPQRGLLAGLYEFINLNQAYSIKQIEMMYPLANVLSLPFAKHIFTHKEWHMTMYRVQLQQRIPLLDTQIWVKVNELEQYAIPSAFDGMKQCIHQQQFIQESLFEKK